MGGIVSITRRDLNVNRSVVLFFLSEGKCSYKGTLMGYGKDAVCLFIVFLAHVIFGKFETLTKMDIFYYYFDFIDFFP